VETPDQVTSVGTKVHVKVMDVDEERRRISLSMRSAAETLGFEIEITGATEPAEGEDDAEVETDEVVEVAADEAVAEEVVAEETPEAAEEEAPVEEVAPEAVEPEVAEEPAAEEVVAEEEAPVEEAAPEIVEEEAAE
jgi:small subunit ribosomal protein S1